MSILAKEFLIRTDSFMFPGFQYSLPPFGGATCEPRALVSRLLQRLLIESDHVSFSTRPRIQCVAGIFHGFPGQAGNHLPCDAKIAQAVGDIDLFEEVANPCNYG